MYIGEKCILVSTLLFYLFKLDKSNLPIWGLIYLLFFVFYNELTNIFSYLTYAYKENLASFLFIVNFLFSTEEYKF